MSACGGGYRAFGNRDVGALPSQLARHLNRRYPCLATQEPSGRNPPPSRLFRSRPSYWPSTDTFQMQKAYVTPVPLPLYL